MGLVFNLHAETNLARGAENITQANAVLEICPSILQVDGSVECLVVGDGLILVSEWILQPSIILWRSRLRIYVKDLLRVQYVQHIDVYLSIHITQIKHLVEGHIYIE